MKKLRGLGLLALGVLIGISISFAPELQAATSKLLGSKVGNVLSVKLDGKYIGDGGVIGGTTYVPLRTVSNNLGAEVVRVDKNEVVLSSGPDPTDPNMDQINVKREAIITQIRDLNIKIKEAQSVIDNKAFLEKNMQSTQEMIDLTLKMKENNDPMYSEERLVGLQNTLEKIKKNLSDAETNIVIWEKELADLESQLAELQK